MCREDIRIGRKRVYSDRLVPYNLGNPVRLLAESRNRVFFSVSVGNAIAVIFSKNNINSNANGFAINNNFPVPFRVEDYGQFVTGEVWIDGVALQGTAYVVEVFYDDEEYP